MSTKLKVSRRAFIGKSPSLDAMQWKAEPRFFHNQNYFYGRIYFTVAGTELSIHSYSGHGRNAYHKFVIKMMRIIESINDFITVIENKTETTYSADINGTDTPYSGSVYYHRSTHPISGEYQCVFELASCKSKIRFHAKDLGGNRGLIAVLGRIRRQIDTLIKVSGQVHAEMLNQGMYDK